MRTGQGLPLALVVVFQPEAGLTADESSHFVILGDETGFLTAAAVAITEWDLCHQTRVSRPAFVFCCGVVLLLYHDGRMIAQEPEWMTRLVNPSGGYCGKRFCAAL